MWWPSVDHGTTTCVILYCSRFISHLQHSGPWCPLKCTGKQLWVGGKALELCDSYLHPRHCKVNIKNPYSTPRELPFSVPQDSCTGPVFYSVYASTLQYVITNDQIPLYSYADDHGLIKLQTSNWKWGNCSNGPSKLPHISQGVDGWKLLKMNSSKTEVIIFGFRQQVSKTTMKSMCINAESIEISVCIKYPGVWADQHLTFKYHIKMKCKNLQKLKTIRLVLTTEAANTLVMDTIISLLDYCNSIYIGLPETDLQKLKRVHNITAKTVLGKGKHADPTDCLRALHWLPIKYRVEYKILCMVYKCLTGEALDYLKDMLHEYTWGKVYNQKRHIKDWWYQELSGKHLPQGHLVSMGHLYGIKFQMILGNLAALINLKRTLYSSLFYVLNVILILSSLQSTTETVMLGWHYNKLIKFKLKLKWFQTTTKWSLGRILWHYVRKLYRHWSNSFRRDGITHRTSVKVQNRCYGTVNS